MKYGTEYDKRTLRVCGHGEMFGFSYTNQKQRYQQQLNASRTLCNECKSAIRDVLERCANGQVCDPRSQARNERLPELLGTAGQVSFASSVRDRKASQLFGVMAALEQPGTQVPMAAHYAIRLLFSIPRAKFWLDHREELGTSAWLTRECEILLRTTDTLCGPLPDSSAYAFWMKQNTKVAASARSNARAAITREEVPVIAPNPPQARDGLTLTVTI